MKIYRENNVIVFDDEAGFITQVDPALLFVKISGDNYSFYRTTIYPLFEPISIVDIKNKLGVAYTTNSFNLFLGTNGLVTSVETIDAYTKAETNALLDQKQDSITNYYFVSALSKLPTPVGGVITLEDNATYLFTTVVDLAGNRLVCGQNTTILGGSSENCRIKSTGLIGTALITSNYSLPIRSITIEADLALNLNGDGVTTALDWFGVNFKNCNTIGTIQNYSNFIMTDSAFLNSSGLTFDGTIDTIGFTQCLFDNRTSGTAITLPSTLTVSRRFRIIYSSFVALATETALNVSVSASIPVEGYILDTVNFSGGGNYTNGVQFSDNKPLFVNCRGISNSAEIANYHMANNATLTDIITVNTPVKVAGTTTASSINQRFTHSNNRVTYIGAITRSFRVSSVASVTSSSSNKQIGFYVAKNGVVIDESEMYMTTNTNSRAESIAIQTIITLSTNDYLEIYVENSTDATDITVTFLNTIVESLN